MNSIALILLLLSSAGQASPANGHEFLTYGGFTLGAATLKDVQTRLGPAPLTRTGDGAESESALCYFVPSKHLTVRFLSGELGGPDDTLLSVELLNGPPPIGRPCYTLEANTSAPLERALAGASLNMSSASFRQVLSLPVSGGTALIQRSFCTTRDIAGTTFDSCVFIRGRFTKNHLTSLFVNFTETN